jgi:hypothetical protein
METSDVKKTTKPVSKKTTSAAIRVSTDTRKRFLSELAKINKKQFGKRVRPDALVLKLLAKITAQDVSELQEASLSGRDRVDQSYRAHCTKFGHLSMDDYFALLLNPESSKITNEKAAIS